MCPEARSCAGRVADRDSKSNCVAVVHLTSHSIVRAHALGADLHDEEQARNVEENGNAGDEYEGPSWAHTVEHEGED